MKKPIKKLLYARQCSECKAGMNEGYIIRGGDAYYCSDKCLGRHFTKAEWKKETESLDEDSSSMPEEQSYWTTWHNDEKEY